jgi:uncharacterized protein YndB with AHSA1/START domain
MGHEFEGVDEVTVPATPEQVWDAIATGPGIDSWFMGRNEVEDGTAVRMAFGAYTPEHAITAWEPGQRLAYRSDREEDGRFIAYEFLIEGRDRSSTVLRMATSGFLPGDDWADEYEAMTQGGQLFFRTLVEYLTHFAGRTATPVTVFGPMITDWQRTRARLVAAIGLSGPGAVRFAPEGLPPVVGELYFANTDTIGIRTADALYRFMRGFHGPVVAAHHIFEAIDIEQTEQAWAAWLTHTLED